MDPRPKTLLLSLLASLVVFLSSTPGFAEVSFPEPPGQREFFLDQAELMPQTLEDSLRPELDQILTEHAIPIVVVTIPGLYEYEAEDLTIEQYAQRLFDTWQIGPAQLRVRGAGYGREKVQEWNKGILLLIAKSDRKARIELGAGWGRTQNRLCQDIMDQHIIPSFKKRNYGQGIEFGVRALMQMARGEKIQPPPRPWWHYGLVALFGVLLVGTAINLAQSGASGWAWAFWAAIFTVLGFLLHALLTNSGGSRGYSGGSFGGGGFSGGGGATGSW